MIMSPMRTVAIQLVEMDPERVTSFLVSCRDVLLWICQIMCLVDRFSHPVCAE